MAVSAFVKDPEDNIDFVIDWTLATGDTITASTFTADAGITVGTTQFTNTPTPKTVVWLSGGTDGITYNVVNHITTAAGRQKDHTLIILVQEE